MYTAMKFTDPKLNVKSLYYTDNAAGFLEVVAPDVDFRQRGVHLAERVGQVAQAQTVDFIADDAQSARKKQDAHTWTSLATVRVPHEYTGRAINQ
jgi:hypothetical protein